MLVWETGVLSGGNWHAEADSKAGCQRVQAESGMNRSEDLGFLAMGASEQTWARSSALRGQMPRGKGTA